jgi:nucleoid-associated protein YgaU
MSGEKALLQIFGCTVRKSGYIVIDSTPSFEAMINPEGYDQTLQVAYSQKKAAGGTGGEAKFDHVKPEKIVLKPMTLDGTGAVPGTKLPVKDQIAKLRSAVYSYISEKHEPPIVRVVWGSLGFFARVESMKLEYNFFTPNGEPLRAKVTLSFTGFTNASQEVKQMGKRSPDLTHLVVVKAGDTLPLLCERIYRDPLYHLEVARINGLTQVRQLEPGMQLRFPPLA